MTGYTVAVVGAAGVAAELGKRGTQSDITLYNTTHDGHHTTLVEPTQFPDKFPPLLYALAMADRCLLVVQELSRPVAETIATVDLADLPTEVLLGSSVDPSGVSTVLRGTRFESVEPVLLGFPELRERLTTWRVADAPGTVRVPLDHAFPVKGVGAVGLGVVRRGTLHAHETLRLWPGPKTVEIRSIQVHDVDVKQATVGERVGVALKGVDADELSRGQVLALPTDLAAASELTAGGVRRCRYYKEDWGEGSSLHLSVGLQMVPVVVGPKTGEGYRLQCDRPVAYSSGDPAFLADLSATAGPRIVARLTLA